MFPRRSSSVPLTVVVIIAAAGLFTTCTDISDEDVVRVPVVFGIMPSSGVYQTEVSITGANFNPFKEKNNIFINGMEAEVIAHNPGELKVLVPRRAGSGLVQVSVNGELALNAPLFTYRLSIARLSGTEDIGHRDGPIGQALFEAINGMVSDDNGDLYIIDGNYIRKISAETVSTIAGNGEFGFSDGVGQEASFAQPSAIDIDENGTLYVADTYNHAIRKITQDGLVTTIAGQGVAGLEDGSDGEALFAFPEGIAIAGPDEIYIADSGNNRIRLMTSIGIVTTIAGSGGGAGYKDGVALGATLNRPSQLALGRNGELYFTEPHQNMIRKLHSGEITTVAGNLEAGHVDGPGIQAEFAFPIGITMDRENNLIVADAGNSYLRRITPGGMVTTIGGNGDTEDTFGELANAGIGMPRYVAASKDGIFYLSAYMPRVLIIE